MRRLLTTALVIVMFTGLLSAPSLAEESGTANPPEDVQQMLIEKFSEPVVFFIDSLDKLARRVWVSADVVSGPDVTADLGPGCIPDGVEEYVNTVAVVATSFDSEVQVFFPMAIRDGATIFDVVFTGRCYSDTDEKLYDRFEATIVNNRGIARMVSPNP